MAVPRFISTKPRRKRKFENDPRRCRALAKRHVGISLSCQSRSCDALCRASAPWFNLNLDCGTRAETMDFEERFRTFGREAVEVWFEVIFWKLASTRRLGESRAERMIENLRVIKASAPRMWSACAGFVASRSRKSFVGLQEELFIVAKGIPVAATFPAFMCPEQFPMIDRWIAKWVMRSREAHLAEAESSGLVAPSESFIAGRKTTLTVSGDWDFYQGWIEWSRAAANLLRRQTGFDWRARDVEMAAFENERSSSPLLPPVGVL